MPNASSSNSPRTLLSIPANSSADAEPVLLLGSSLPKTRNGLPCHYYWRQSMQDGDWTNQAKGFTLPVTPQLRSEVEQTFRAMKAGGDEVPVVKDHKETADATLGYVHDVRQVGPWMEELHQYLGDDAAETALRNKLSVGLEPNFKDSRNRQFKVALVHSAVTCRPVIPGQGDALIAASRGGSYDILPMSIALPPIEETAPTPDPEVAGVEMTSGDNPTGATNMADKMLPCSDATLAVLHKHVPGLKTAPDADKLSRVAQHIHTTAMSDAADAGYDMSAVEKAEVIDPAVFTKAKDNRKAWKIAFDDLAVAKQNLSAANEAKAAAVTKATEAEAKVLQLSQAVEEAKKEKPAQVTTPAYDPSTLMLLSRALSTESQSAVSTGGIDPATAEKVSKLLASDGKPSTLCLSQVLGAQDPFGFLLWQALKDNKPRPMGQQTGIQAMSRVDPDTGITSDGQKAASAALMAGANPGTKSA